MFLKVIAFCLCFVPCMAEESFLLIGSTGEVIAAFGPHTDKRISPCSTFKIPLSLMGYDALILKDEKNPVWDYQEGYDDWISLWKEPQTPQSWMQCSCVWYSKILTIQLGLSQIQNYLTLLDYGNQDVSGGLTSPGPLKPFWINSSLKISPKEQVAFIHKMIQEQLPVSSDAIHLTKAILFKETLPNGWKLFGKTGWSGSDIAKDGQTLEHSWFVGWIEKDLNFYPFAYLIRDKKINLEQRIPRVKQLLLEYLNEDKK